jgi:NADH-quinone oxidoreductase subunit L
VAVDAAAAALAAVLAPYAAAALVLLEALAGARWRLLAWTGVLGTLVAAVAAWAALPCGMGGGCGFSVPWVGSLGVSFGVRVDALSAIVGVVVATLSFLIALYSVEYIGEWGAARYWVFYSFFVGSMLLLVYASDLAVMFIGWEGTGLSSWALIGFYYDDREEAWVGDPGRRSLGVPMWFTPTHSALRAISFTRVGDIAMLLGLGVVYAALGSTGLGALASGGGRLGLELALRGITPAWLVLFYAGALAKSAQFPFHEWLVTAMTGPTSVSALIHAATMVKAGVYYALRLTPLVAPVLLGSIALAGSASAVYSGLAWLALLTAFATATMAIVARELKLVLAFSTASQLSYMMGAVFAAAAAGEVGEGVFGGLAHLVSHAVFKATLFLVAGAMIHAVHSRYMDDMGGLRRYMPLSFAAFLLAGLSLSAIPPFSGWWSKDLAVHAIGLLGDWALAAALATAVLTAFYTARMLYLVFLGEPRFHGSPHEPGPLMLYPYLALGLASLGLGLAWPLLEHGLAAAAGLEEAPMEPAAMLVSALLAAAGFAAGLLLYQRWGPRPGERLARNPLGALIHGFLYDRWLVNALIYRLIVYPGWRLAILLNRTERLLDAAVHGGAAALGLAAVRRIQSVEARYDRLVHVRLAEAGAAVSSEVRRLQTGDIRDYMAYFMAGMVLAAVLSALVIGFLAGPP